MNTYNDYYIVCEQTSDPAKPEIVEEVSNSKLDFLRFKACLQAFYKPLNRNRRSWKASQIRTMSEAAPIRELIQRKSLFGEAGHPVPSTGQVTLERILTIDPLRTTHRINSFYWPSDNQINGEIETLDDGPGGPGNKMKRTIMQGAEVAFSLRSLVPQRKNADGTVTVLGPGRMVTYDWVILPSHEEAYQDTSIPVKEVVTAPKFAAVMESFNHFMLNNSDKVRSVLDGLDPALESATYDEKSGMMSVGTAAGRVFVRPETKYANEYIDLLKGL